jgi:transcriptional regulator with XRE-family HTH domain
MTELNTDYLKTVGERIARLREEKGVTQEAFGRALNIPRSTLAKYETGLQDFKSETIVQMCDYFGVSADYLLRGASAKALDIHRKTGLTDAAILSLEDEKTIADVMDDGRINMVNVLLADKEFFFLLEEFVHFKNEWHAINTELAVAKRNSDTVPQLRERAEFLRWKYFQQVEKYIERLLEGK